MVDASNLNLLKNMNRQHDLLAAHGTAGLRARVHKSLQDEDQANNVCCCGKLKDALELKELHDLKLLYTSNLCNLTLKAKAFTDASVT
ncbi:hypothetical protein Tco_1025198 [Tanacetum coccineum]